ncbi:capsular polysaccharide biosynthesis protein [Vreelandella subglaciescola]|jgi:capsular polysaccharide export protein|uniref:Capsular polysaccharide export protein n=1 Tax=Vreelandella subglaciescola TaxID=29571 RepID=A0A1M7FH83_9GAMM|nr:capsular polysaccharide biosynthesis protein [Halomonas subglaciescola]SHM03462.1 capsular polysaccharide export protein [Halomonas subglaciescola]
MVLLTAGYTSPGIGKITALSAFLPEFSAFTRLRLLAKKPDAIIGWGLKPTSRKARQYALKHDIPYVALEDGFLRSLGPGSSGYQPNSLIVDSRSIYYDASRPSDLEVSLNEVTFTAEELNEAKHSIALLQHYRLSKYNHAPDELPANLPDTNVLVVDQTAGDASITCGQANAATFDEMLTAALTQHPDSTLWVKTHPDVISGKKQGHLSRAVEHPRCHLIGDDVNPWALFDQVDEVYTVTSQLGFEALMAGKQVHCFGLPFYAGWGLTHDAQPCPRRRRSRTLTEVFAAAYLRYCRYANPYTGQPSTLRDTIALIADQRRQRERCRGHWLACGFSGWKRRFVGDFTGDANSLIHYARPALMPASQAPLLAWSSNIEADLIAHTRHQKAPLWRMEDGFIRSAGLGVDLTRPLSLVLDRQGIYYDPRQPSDLETLLNTTTFSQDLLIRAHALRQRLVALRLSKYNLSGRKTRHNSFPPNRTCILVPGQVESDASIAAGSPEISTNSALLKAVRHAQPHAYILYKAHPDVLSGARIGELDDSARHFYDLDVSHEEITGLLECVDSVHTMSSLTGFEALLRGCTVHTYGLPFYAGWGLTHDAMHCARRTRPLSLEALIAGTLILYPHYVDPASGQLCNAETVITLLENATCRPNRLTWRQQLYRLYRNRFIGRH